MLSWYLKHGLKVTAVHSYVKYVSGKPFKWFPEEVSGARRDGDNNPELKILEIPTNSWVTLPMEK